VERGGFASGFGSKVNQPVNDDLTVPSLAIKYDFAGLSLQSDTSYVDRSYNDFDDWSNFLGAFFGAPPLAPELSGFTSYDQNIVWTKAWQQELRLSSQDTSSRINWVAGAYYRHSIDGVEQVIAPNLDPLTQYLFGATSLQAFGIPDFVLGGTAYNSYSRFKTVTVQEALFGEVTVNIVGGLKANIGLRVEHSSVQDQDQQYGGPLQGVAFAHVILPNQEQTPVTPRFGLTYQYTDNDMVYATAAKGYRPGGSNSPNATQNPLCAPSFEALGLSSVPTTYDSDSIWSYEVGAKDSLFDRRLSLQSSVYFIDWTGIQTSVNLLSCGAFYTTNRGKAISKGFDFQVAGVVVDGLKVSANVGYTDAYYPRAAYGAPVDGVIPILNAAGDKLHGVLPWTASAHLDYSLDTGRYLEGSRSYFRLDYRWLDAAPKYNPVTANYDPIANSQTNEAYGTLNLRLGALRGGADVSAYVENATNANPLLGLSHASVGDPLLSATAIRPRTVGLTALYRF
jgi:iron complex outermembrane receptor protein